MLHFHTMLPCSPTVIEKSIQHLGGPGGIHDVLSRLEKKCLDTAVKVTPFPAKMFRKRQIWQSLEN